MAHYADDFAAVIAALAPGEKVHVLAHDWGSVGIWEYLSRPESVDRIASFTSTSGPSADHTRRFIMEGLKRPYQPVRFLHSVSQFLRLTYQGFFSIPLVARVLVRATVPTILPQLMKRLDGMSDNQIRHSDTFATDAANSLKVYPANYWRTIVTGRRDHYIDVPVQVIVNRGDQFVRPHLYDETPQWVPRLWRGTSSRATGRRCRIRSCSPPPSVNSPIISRAPSRPGICNWRRSARAGRQPAGLPSTVMFLGSTGWPLIVIW